MPLPDVWDLLEYWRRQPPEHESLAVLLGAFTDWEPPAPVTIDAPTSAAELSTVHDVAKAIGVQAQPMPAAIRALLNDAAALNDRLAGKLPN